MNKPNWKEPRKTPHRYGEKTHGIHMSRFCASWVNAGGKSYDRDGFILWMMNIPFKEEDGSISYISLDDAEDAYWMMHVGKIELEFNAREFMKEHGTDNKGYVIIPEEE